MNPRPLLVVLVAVVALAVLGGAGYGIHRWLNPTCGPGVALVDDECIGITDGAAALTSYDDPAMADVLGRIKAENDRIGAGQVPVVTVGYLLPIPRRDSLGAASELPARLHELQGAFVAQLAANTEDAPVHVRLVIANGGDQSVRWQDVVPDLVALAEEPTDRLVAVVATGESRTPTQQAITALTTQRVPVVTTRLTADVLTTVSTDDRTFARIAPSNSDEAAALATSLLRGGPAPALVVRSTDSADAYVQSLAQAFTTSYRAGGGTVLGPEETFNPGRNSFMASVVGSVCARRPSVVMFAGRSADLQQFVSAWPRRSCPDLKIRIVTGDDAVDFAAAVAADAAKVPPGAVPPAIGPIGGLRSGATVLYAGVADAAAWDAYRPEFSEGAYSPLRESCPTCFRGQFRDSSLADGAAIMGHDAIVTVATALTFGAQLNDSAEGVASAFKRLHGPDSIALASGWLSLAPNGDAINKAVPILQVGLDGVPVLVDFGSSTGTPCVPGRTLC